MLEFLCEHVNYILNPNKCLDVMHYLRCFVSFVLYVCEMLRAKEHAPTPSPSIVFTFGLKVESIKELGGNDVT
jgi:hypothetical protein